MARRLLSIEMQDVLKLMEILSEETDTYGHLRTSDLAIEVVLTDSNGEHVGTVAFDRDADGFVLEVMDQGVITPGAHRIAF